MAATALPVNFDLRIYRGDDYFLGLVYDEVNEDGSSDITTPDGWTALLQIRTAPGGSVWLALTETDGLTLNAGADGGIETTVHIAAAVTAADEWASRSAGSWDFQLTSPDGVVTTPFAGRATIVQDISRMVTP